jgi:hypothetical protein
VTARSLLFRPTHQLSIEEFGWDGPTGESSFHTELDPELRAIGDVAAADQDLVAVAVAVFLADRTVKRPKEWQRTIELAVPVYDTNRWRAVSERVGGVLELLSADEWQLEFQPRVAVKPRAPTQRPDVDRVLLFSGGADSLCGAIKSLAAGDRLLLVSHWDWTGHSAVQRRLVDALKNRFPGQVHHRQHRLAKRRTQIGGGEFRDEATRRTRSLLFLSLGLAHASLEPRVPLWIAENGYAALNPPLAGERRGALSTRTTHPLVFDRLAAIIGEVGGSPQFENPFAATTKGEMFAEIAATLGVAETEHLLGLSHSCSHVRYAQGTGLPPDTQCGFCYGCLVRRAAFHHAGLRDTAIYINTVVAPAAQPTHLRATAEREIRTVRYAGMRGVTVADILTVGLPEAASIDDAVAVAQRGLAELAAIVDVAPDLNAIQ